MGKHSGTNSGLGGFMNGASIRFSKMKGSGGAGGVDAWRDMLTNRNPSAPSAPSSARRPRTTGTELPKLQSIHEGTVVSIQPFGAFMQLGNGDMYKDGLLHLSCMAKERVEKVEDAGLELDMKIWVKVSEVKEMDGKYSLDMRYVNQKDGTDLDPYHTKGRVPDNFFEGKFKRAALAAAPPVAPPADSDDDIEPDRKAKRKRETKESSSESDSGDGTGLNVEKMPPKLRKKYEKARSKLLKARQQHASLIEKASALPSKREVKEDKSKKAKDKVKEKEKAHKKEKEVLSGKLKVKSEPSSSCSSSSSSS